MATLYPALGNTQTITPTNGKTFTLEELQAAVGGPVQLIRYSSTEVLFVHAEGQLHHLPINEKMTTLVGQDLLQTCLGVAHLVGNVLLCTNTEAGLSNPRRTRAQRAIVLCSWCQEQVTALSHHIYCNCRSDWQTLGKYYTLKDVANWLSRITTQTSPSQVHTEVERVLDHLALRKANCLIEGITKSEAREILAWEAEGIIAQIDALVPELWKLLSREWRHSDKKHGQYYHIYHAVDHEATLDIQVGIHRWASAQRTQFYREVALLKVEGQSPLHEVFRLTNHVEHNWQQNSEVLWFRDGTPLRSTSTGDIVVSLVSGTAWIVDHVGWKPIAESNEDHKAETAALTTQNLQEMAERLECVLKGRRFTFIQHRLDGPASVEEQVVLVKPDPSTPFILTLPTALHVHQTDGTTNGTVALPVGATITIRDREIDIDLQGRYANRSHFQYRIED